MTKAPLLRPLSPDHGESLRLAEEAAGKALRRLDWPGGEEGPDRRRWGIFEPRTGELLGVARLDGLSPGGSAVLSAWIRDDRTGRGLGTRAAAEALAAAFRAEGLRRVSARIEPSNRPARRVLQKLGFRYEGRLRQDRKINGRWVDQECWGLLKKEWKP